MIFYHLHQTRFQATAFFLSEPIIFLRFPLFREPVTISFNFGWFNRNAGARDSLNDGRLPADSQRTGSLFSAERRLLTSEGKATETGSTV